MVVKRLGITSEMKSGSVRGTVPPGFSYFAVSFALLVAGGTGGEGVSV